MSWRKFQTELEMGEVRYSTEKYLINIINYVYKTNYLEWFLIVEYGVGGDYPSVK